MASNPSASMANKIGPASAEDFHGNYMKVGRPDAVYRDGKSWKGMVAVCIADTAYDGDDKGGAATFAFLYLL